jgi:hypothetical protein
MPQMSRPFPNGPNNSSSGEHPLVKGLFALRGRRRTERRVRFKLFSSMMEIMILL